MEHRDSLCFEIAFTASKFRDVGDTSRVVAVEATSDKLLPLVSVPGSWFQRTPKKASEDDDRGAAGRCG